MRPLKVELRDEGAAESLRARSTIAVRNGSPPQLPSEVCPESKYKVTLPRVALSAVTGPDASHTMAVEYASFSQAPLAAI